MTSKKKSRNNKIYKVCQYSSPEIEMDLTGRRLFELSHLEENNQSKLKLRTMSGIFVMKARKCLFDNLSMYIILSTPTCYYCNTLYIIRP